MTASNAQQVDLSDDKTLEKIKAIDPWVWLKYGQLTLLGGQYQVEGHEYQIPILQSQHQKVCYKKSTQRGYTMIEIVRSLHGLKNGRYAQGVIHVFPTADEVTVFSKSRFKTFLSQNYHEIGRFVQETDSVDVKRIGDAFLYFRGARLSTDIEGAQKSSSKAKSTPADRVVFDEIEEMDQDAIQLFLARMEHSKIKEEAYLANPTVPGHGIDKLYQSSDQRVWFIECTHCGRETCLELEFPNCLKRQRDGTVIRACKHCGREIYPKNGYWVAQAPGRDMAGYWDSALGSTYKNPKEILDAYEDPETDLTRFNNLILGKAYIKAEDLLTINDVYLCCGPDTMAMAHTGPTAMGVDVGGKLHVVIGEKRGTKGLKLVKAARVSTFNDVWDLAKRYGVRSAVFDLYPEIHKVREFCATAQFPCFGCAYSEEQRGVAAWNEGSRVVTVNRTEMCDATHKLVKMPGWLELPRKDAEVEEFALEMINIYKILVEDKKTGSMVYRYRKDGADHYRHALNYLLLASARIKAISRTGVAVTIEPTTWMY